MPSVERIAVAGGRRLAVWTYGRASAYPVLYLHGTPSSHMEWEVFGDDALLDRHNLRIVAPDRPGMGASTFLPGRRLSDWPADAAAIVAALGLDRFSILGYSGGGAYAVATALSMPARVTSLALVAPVVHASPAMIEGLDANGLRIKEMARTRPRLARFVLGLSMGLPARFLPSFLAGQMRKTLPPADNAAMAEGARLPRFMATLRDAFRAGAAGPQHELGLIGMPWDIALTPAPFPVHIWQGEDDTFGARPAMARYLAAALGAADLRILRDGHISIFTRHLDDILAALKPA